MSKKTFKSRYFWCALAFAAFHPSLKADLLQDGREAFMRYDFERAAELYEKYAKSLQKNPDLSKETILEQYRRQLEIAENSLDNVQKIEVIDRMDVPVTDFFKYIKLPASGGRLLPPDVSVLKNRNNSSDFAYSSESGDLMIWSECDENGREVIMQSERLMDGSWEKPSQAGVILNDGGNSRNPFMLSDGITLYYSSDGDGSMGGFDIFVAAKDPSSGEFRQPLGVGYPFNSPFNEYMMAIDEDNGVGWWVTDRNQIDGKVSVYVFKTNEVRKNYDAEEEEDIVSLAKLSDISLSQNPATDYKGLLSGISNRAEVSRKSGSPDFIFPLQGGRIARSMSDFSSGDAKRLMTRYLNALEELSRHELKLSELRRQYHVAERKKGSSTALKNQILDGENKRDSLIKSVKELRNAVVSAELKQ